MLPGRTLGRANTGPGTRPARCQSSHGMSRGWAYLRGSCCNADRICRGSSSREFPGGDCCFAFENGFGALAFQGVLSCDRPVAADDCRSVGRAFDAAGDFPFTSENSGTTASHPSMKNVAKTVGVTGSITTSCRAPVTMVRPVTGFVLMTPSVPGDAAFVFKDFAAFAGWRFDDHTFVGDSICVGDCPRSHFGSPTSSFLRVPRPSTAPVASNSRFVAAIVSLKIVLLGPFVVAFVFALLSLACVSSVIATWPNLLPASPGAQCAEANCLVAALSTHVKAVWPADAA